MEGSGKRWAVGAQERIHFNFKGVKAQRENGGHFSHLSQDLGEGVYKGLRLNT